MKITLIESFVKMPWWWLNKIAEMLFVVKKWKLIIQGAVYWKQESRPSMLIFFLWLDFRCLRRWSRAEAWSSRALPSSRLRVSSRGARLRRGRRRRSSTPRRTTPGRTPRSSSSRTPTAVDTASTRYVVRGRKETNGEHISRRPPLKTPCAHFLYRFIEKG